MSRLAAIFPEQGLTDPHALVAGGRLYLLCGHDASMDNESWVMDEWQIRSTADLVDWRLECRIRPEDTFMGARHRCWGADLAARDGRFFVYFSDGPDGTGVLAADAPGGPYRDVLGRRLVSREQTPDTQPYDPDAFEDDDGEHYLFFGCGRYYAARLARSMTALAEAPRPIEIQGAAGVSDKACVFKRSGRYYLAWGGQYAMADGVYGPYTRVGPFLDAHSNVCRWKGRDLLFHEQKDIGLFYRGCAFRTLRLRTDGKADWDASGGCRADPPGRAWDFSRSAMGWRALGGTTLEWIPSGGIRGVLDGPGRIESALFPLADLDRCKRVRLRLRNGTVAERLVLRFAARSEEPCWFLNPAVHWREEDAIEFAVRPRDARFRDYELDLSGHPGWRLDLKRLRLEFPPDVRGGAWEIRNMNIQETDVRT